MMRNDLLQKKAQEAPQTTPLPPLKFVKGKQEADSHYVLIYVDTDKLDHDWSKEPDFYIKRGGPSAISDRRERFEKWLKDNPNTPIEAPFVGWNEYKGSVGFTDGRHRFSVLRDLGYPTVGVTIARSDLKYFKPLMKAASTKTAEAAPYNRIQAILDEMMADVEGGLPTPPLKIVNNLKSRWLGRCTWRYGEPNTKVEIQKSITHDEHTIRRILAHELAHHENFLRRYGPMPTYKSYVQQYKLDGGGHGRYWEAIAERWNKKYGAGYITRTSDESYDVQHDEKAFFTVIWKDRSGIIRFASSSNLSVQAVRKLWDMGRILGASRSDEYRLFKTSDRDFLTQVGIGDGRYTSRFDRPDIVAKAKQLFETGEDLWKKEVDDRVQTPAKPVGRFFVLISKQTYGSRVYMWQQTTNLSEKQKEKLGMYARMVAADRTEAKLVVSTNLFLKAGARLDNSRWSYPRTPDEDKACEEAWNSPDLLPRYKDSRPRFFSSLLNKDAKDFGYSRFNDREAELSKVEFSLSNVSENSFQVDANYEGKLIAWITSHVERGGNWNYPDYTVDAINIMDKTWRGTGLGQMLYDKAIEEAKNREAEYFYSDEDLTPEAQRAWARLKQRYPVENLAGQATSYEIGGKNIHPTHRYRIKLSSAAEDEREVKFNELADEQRGAPEDAMLKVQMHPLGAGVGPHTLEHVGDLTNRMAQHFNAFKGQYGIVRDKVEKTLRWLTNDYGFERELMGNVTNNYEALKDDKLKGRSFEEVKDEFFKLWDNYAMAHSKLRVFNYPQRLARDAAIELGQRNFKAAINNLRLLKNIIDKGQEAYIQAVGEFNMKPKAASIPPTHTMYHVSRFRNRNYILNKGLLPLIKEYKDLNRKPGIYLFETYAQASDWAFYFGQTYGGRVDIWEVKLPSGIEVEPDLHPEINDIYDAWITQTPIPPDNIKVVKTVGPKYKDEDAPPMNPMKVVRAADVAPWHRRTVTQPPKQKNFQPLSFEEFLKEQNLMDAAQEMDGEELERKEIEYEENVEHFGSINFPVTIYRQVEVPSGKSLNFDSAGVYWSWVEDSAQAYYGGSSMWSSGGEKGELVTIKAQVLHPDDVDWQGTIRANFIDPEENEIRVLQGAELKLLGVQGEKDNMYKPVPGQMTIVATHKVTPFSQHEFPNMDSNDGEGSSAYSVMPEYIDGANTESVLGVKSKNVKTFPSLKAAGVEFTTSQGSIYRVEGHTTQREKSLHKLHDVKDVGIQPKSELTVYVSPNFATEVGRWNTLSSRNKQIRLEGDQIMLLSDAGTGKLGRDVLVYDPTFTLTPEVGKSPLELWDKNEMGHYKGNHAGNVITEVRKVAGAGDRNTYIPHENPSSPVLHTDPLFPEDKTGSAVDWYWNTSGKTWHLIQNSKVLAKVVEGTFGTGTATVNGQTKKFLSAIKAIEWAEQQAGVK